MKLNFMNVAQLARNNGYLDQYWINLFKNTKRNFVIMHNENWMFYSWESRYQNFIKNLIR